MGRPDHGAFAARVLLDPGPYIGHRIELASDAPTPAQMAAALSAALGRQVRHERVPLEAIGNPDMHAMWSFLNGPGYRVDIAALHAAHPEIAWTSFAEWAQHTFGAARSYPRRFFGDASVRGECLLSPGARAATTGGTCRSI